MGPTFNGIGLFLIHLYTMFYGDIYIPNDKAKFKCWSQNKGH